MGEPHIHTTLEAKRAELSGELIRLESEKAKIRSQITHIDHVLALFGYRDEPRKIKPVQRRKNRFKAMEVQKYVRKFERDAGAELPRKALALMILKAKGWDTEDAKLVAQVCEAVKNAKKALRQRGI